MDVAKGKREVAMRAYAQGVKLVQLGDYVRAADFFRAAVQSQPEEAQFHDRLATCLLKSKRNFTEAVASAEKAAELDPYKSDYKIHLAELFEAIGNHQRALDAYRDILKWDPENLLAQAKIREATANNSPFNRFMRWYGKLVGR
jgi:tetratricopeptide (TPR) repeat protein